MGGAMGWTPAEVGACGLAEFMACWEGFAALHGIGGRSDGQMTRAEAMALRAELFDDE